MSGEAHVPGEWVERFIAVMLSRWMASRQKERTVLRDAASSSRLVSHLVLLARIILTLSGSRTLETTERYLSELFFPLRSTRKQLESLVNRNLETISGSTCIHQERRLLQIAHHLWIGRRHHSTFTLSMISRHIHFILFFRLIISPVFF